MQLEKVMNIINDIEKKFPVDEWKINNIHVWPIIRIELGMRLQYIDEPYLDNNTTNRRSPIRKIIEFVRLFLQDIIAEWKDVGKNQKPYNTQGGFIFLSDSNNRRVSINNSWYNIYCSPLIEEIKKQNSNYLLLEYCATKKYKFPRFEASYLVEKWLKWIRVYSYVLRQLKRDVDSLNINWYEDLAAYLRQQGLEDCCEDVRELKRKINELTALTVYYDKILHITKPSVAFVICYYGTITMAFVLACKKRKIPVVDIQHGVQGELHVAYGRWNKVPVSGYELLPDIFAVWGETERLAINEWASQNSRHRSFILGNYWNDMWQSEQNDEVINCLIKKIQSNFNSSQFEAAILYTLQPGVITPDFLIEVIRQTPNIHWLIRLHPCMMAQKEELYQQWESYGIKNIEIRKATDFPLPGLLKFIRVHITNSSSVVIDAVQFGIASIVIDRLGSEIYDHYIKENMVFYCSDQQMIITKIKQILERPIGKTVQVNHYSLSTRLFELKRIARNMV